MFGVEKISDLTDVVTKHWVDKLTDIFKVDGIDIELTNSSDEARLLNHTKLGEEVLQNLAINWRETLR